MKKLIAMTLACSFIGAMGSAIAADETEYPTRTLRADHATTTGSPSYADVEMDQNQIEREEAVDRENWISADDKMDDHRAFIEPKNEYDFLRLKIIRGYMGRRGYGDEL